MDALPLPPSDPAPSARVRTPHAARGLRIAHLADWHLGFPFARIAARDAALTDELRRGLTDAIGQLFAVCVEEAVDLILIAGDLFDRPRPTAALVEAFQAHAAAHPERPLVIAAGNHDPLLPDSHWLAGGWPAHVHLLPAEGGRVALPQLGVTVDGASFARLLEPEPIFTGLEPAPPVDCLAICLLHGSWDPPTGRADYNPIAADAAWLGDYDLIALGHQHRPLHTRIAWGRRGELRMPGPLARHGYDEAGEAGLWIGDWRREGGRWRANWRQRPLTGAQWLDWTHALEAGEGMEASSQRLAAQLPAPRGTGLLRLTLRGRRAEGEAWTPVHFEAQARRRGWRWVELSDETRPALPALADPSRRHVGFAAILAEQAQLRLDGAGAEERALLEAALVRIADLLDDPEGPR